MYLCDDCVRDECVLGLDKFLMFSNGPEIHGIVLNVSSGEEGGGDDERNSQALTPITRIENAVAIDYSANSRKYTGTVQMLLTTVQILESIQVDMVIHCCANSRNYSGICGIDYSANSRKYTGTVVIDFSANSRKYTGTCGIDYSANSRKYTSTYCY